MRAYLETRYGRLFSDFEVFERHYMLPAPPGAPLEVPLDPATPPMGYDGIAARQFFNIATQDGVSGETPENFLAMMKNYLNARYGAEMRLDDEEVVRKFVPDHAVESVLEMLHPSRVEAGSDVETCDGLGVLCLRWKRSDLTRVWRQSMYLHALQEPVHLQLANLSLQRYQLTRALDSACIFHGVIAIVLGFVRRKRPLPETSLSSRIVTHPPR